MTATPNKIPFTILWYSGGPDHAPNRVIARDIVTTRDLTDAIAKACNMLKASKGSHDGYAHGFYVRKSTDYELDAKGVSAEEGS